MEINRLGNQADRLAGAGGSDGEPARHARAERPPPRGAHDWAYDRTVGGDSVEISETPRLLARARQAADSAPAVGEEKVARLKQQIAAGTYRVPAELLARKLLGEI